MKPRFRHAHPPAHRQKGQALVLGMFILVIVAMLTFFQFSTGQVTTARMRLVNATDAAAYSAGLWRARVFNYYAYSNRAIIFNEVAIAQTATLLSYTGFLTQVVKTVDNKTWWIPYWGQLIKEVSEMAEAANQALQLISSVEVGARGLYVKALSAGQTAMNATTNGWFMTQLATEVMNKADASFHAFVPEPNERLSVQRKGDDRGRLREVVTGSLDDYSKNRSSTLNLFNMVRVEWRGQTEMIRDHEASMDRWQAYDTLSIHERKHGLFGGMRERKPIGWSGVELAANPKNGMDALQGWTWTEEGRPVWQPASNASGEKTTNARAYREISRSRFWSSRAYSGLPGVRELNLSRDALNAEAGRFPTDSVVVIGAIRKNNTINTADQAKIGAGRLKLKDNFADMPALRATNLGHASMVAVSRARIYFRRPPGADNRLEYASMYSPYWQVRLDEVSDAERADAIATGGHGGAALRVLNGAS